MFWQLSPSPSGPAIEYQPPAPTPQARVSASGCAHSDKCLSLRRSSKVTLPAQSLPLKVNGHTTNGAAQAGSGESKALLGPQALLYTVILV